MSQQFKTAALLLAATLSGCSLAANSVGWPAVLDADSKSHKCIAALAAGDKSQLLALHISDTLADKILADSAGRIASKDATFVMEDFVDDRYCREYTVARVKTDPHSNSTIDVRLWFTKSPSEIAKDYAILKSVEFIEKKE